MRYAAKSAALWQLIAVYTAKCFAAYSLIFWTPLVISDLLSRGRGPGAAAGTTHDLTAVLLTAVPYAFAAVSSYFVGWSSHAWDERRAHTYVPFGVGAAVLLAAPLLQVCMLRLLCTVQLRPMQSLLRIAACVAILQSPGHPNSSCCDCIH